MSTDRVQSAPHHRNRFHPHTPSRATARVAAMYAAPSRTSLSFAHPTPRAAARGDARRTVRARFSSSRGLPRVGAATRVVALSRTDARYVRTHGAHSRHLSLVRAAEGDGEDECDAENPSESCDLEFMKLVREDAESPTTGYALQATYFGVAMSVAIALYITLGLGSTTASYDAWRSLVGAMAKSGFTAAFALIFVSELGDKTFFIAALLAMRLGRFRVLIGATSALATMTVISVAIGRAFQKLPSGLMTTLPVGEYAACALLLFFGIKTLKESLEIPKIGSTPEEHGELAEATEVVCKSTAQRGPLLTALVETFTLIFIAEWGDRSMLATVALGAAQNPIGVACGATFGHFLATLIAVVGGSLLSKRISERTVGIIGGVLFLIFAVATALGVF